MKINDATLQNILKTYGKEIKPDKSRGKLQKQEPINKDNIEKETISEDLDIVNYDKEGKVKIDSQKKDALIDFFE
jgi:hypothetical protein